jgi:hypothetical protein
MAINYTERNARIQVTVDNTPIQGSIFASVEGGQAEAATEFIRPGNMAPGVVVGGIVTPGDITATCYYNDTSATWVASLYAAAGVSNVSVTVTPLDGDRNPQPGSLTWTGVLKTTTVPKRDSTSSTPAMLSLVIAPNEGVIQS